MAMPAGGRVHQLTGSPAFLIESKTWSSVVPLEDIYKAAYPHDGIHLYLELHLHTTQKGR